MTARLTIVRGLLALGAVVLALVAVAPAAAVPVDRNGKKACSLTLAGGGVVYVPHNTELVTASGKKWLCIDGHWTPVIVIHVKAPAPVVRPYETVDFGLVTVAGDTR
jgi:hypothetical protein